MRRAKQRAVNRRLRIVIKFFDQLKKMVIANLSMIVQKTEIPLNSEFIERAFRGSEAIFDRFADEILLSGITEAQLFGEIGLASVSEKQATQQFLDLMQIKGQAQLTADAGLLKIPLETTKKQFATLFNNFNKLPENKRSFARLIQEVESKFEHISQRTFSRARTIATTESNRLANVSLLEGAKQGQATHKQWVWSHVERDFHASINGQTVPIDSAFTSGLGNKALHPTGFGVPEEDINCTCDVVFLTLDAEEALDV